MTAVHQVAEVRAAEDRLMALLPSGALMQRAAAGLARRCGLLLERVYGSDVVLLVGSGNNGGDALFAGERLAARGARVTALVVGSTPHEAGLAGLRRAGGWVRDAADDDVLAGADLVVDGLVGIGGRGALREPAARLARAAAESGARVVAVDVPSGVDADTGEVAGTAVRADVTVTFGTLKPGLLISPGAEYAGEVELVDIGLEVELPPARMQRYDARDVSARLVRPRGESSKYLRGVVGVVAGSTQYTGAAVLATGGAVRAGAGMVRFAGVPHTVELIRHAWPEVVVTEVPASAAGTVCDGDAVLGAGRVQAWVIGSGLGTDDAAASVVHAVLGAGVPVLVDADGLTIIADHRDWVAERGAGTLLTPHAGELARLMGADRDDIEAHRLSWARRAADEFGATVLLKGRTTVIADPSGELRVNTTATSWLATAGSGDVLSGVAGALLAQGLSPLDAGACGAFLHGLAGRVAAHRGGDGEAPVAAADLLTCWPAVESTVRAGGGQW